MDLTGYEIQYSERFGDVYVGWNPHSTLYEIRDIEPGYELFYLTSTLDGVISWLDDDGGNDA